MRSYNVTIPRQISSLGFCDPFYDNRIVTKGKRNFLTNDYETSLAFNPDPRFFIDFPVLQKQTKHFS